MQAAGRNDDNRTLAERRCGRTEGRTLEFQTGPVEDRCRTVDVIGGAIPSEAPKRKPRKVSGADDLRSAAGRELANAPGSGQEYLQCAIDIDDLS
jgi:hypothetical protein